MQEKAKSTCACYKRCQNGIGEKGKAVNSGQCSGLWFPESNQGVGGLNVAQGQTAGRQVEDNNGDNGNSLGSIREDREAVVYAHPLHICTLEKK